LHVLGLILPLYYMQIKLQKSNKKQRQRKKLKKKHEPRQQREQDATQRKRDVQQSKKQEKQMKRSDAMKRKLIKLIMMWRMHMKIEKKLKRIDGKPNQKGVAQRIKLDKQEVKMIGL